MCIRDSTKDLASYLGKQITIAFHYKGGQDGAVRQPKFSFNNIRIELAFNNNKDVYKRQGPVIDDGYQDQAYELLNGHTPMGIYRGGKYRCV